MNDVRISTAVGVLVAAFVVAGRWSLARLAGGEASMAFEPRLWIVALLLALAFAPHHLGVERTSTFGRNAGLAWLAFLGYFIVSIAWAPDLEMAIAKAFELALVAGVLASIARVARHLDIAWISRVTWTSLGAIFGVFALLALTNSDPETRLAVLGGGPNVFGRNMALLGLFCVDSVLRRRRRALAAAGLAAAGMLVLLSGSRGAILAATVGTIALLWGHRIRPSRMLWAGIIGATALVGVAIFTDVGQAAVEMFRERVIRLTLEEEHDSGRSEIYEQAIALGWSAPIYGDGLAGFPARGYFVYPHNLGLEAFAEGGFVGVIVLTIALWAPGSTLVRRPIGVAPLDLAGFAALLAAAQFSGDFFDARGLMIFGLLAALQRDLGADQDGPARLAPWRGGRR